MRQAVAGVDPGKGTSTRRPVVLLVDDDAAFARALARSLSDRFDLRHAASRDDALQKLSPMPDVVLLDVRLSDRPDDRQGIGLLEQLRHDYPVLPILMITGFGDIDTAVECVRLGAMDFLEKRGTSSAEVRTRVEQAMQRARLQTRVVELERELHLVEPRTLIGDSDAMLRLREVAQAVAQDGNVSVLVRGETGTGKELVARAIHAGGWRSAGPLVALPLCALPAHTVEAELFGYEPGAFTDARQRYTGYIERAHRGVLLLDEIGEIDTGLQVKLLRFLEEREFNRLGGAPVKVDVQIIAATNADLEGMVRDRRFREDLYFRLKVREIIVPPLRNRPEDIPLLVQHFLALLRQRGRRVVATSPDVDRLLGTFNWPGNIRQLRNAVESAVLDAEMKGRSRLEIDDLPADVLGRGAPVLFGAAARQPNPGDPGFSLQEALGRAELEFVARALRTSGDRITHAWRLLGANDRFVLSRRIKRLLTAHPSLRAEFPHLVARFGVTPGAASGRRAPRKKPRRTP